MEEIRFPSLPFTARADASGAPWTSVRLGAGGGCSHRPQQHRTRPTGPAVPCGAHAAAFASGPLDGISDGAPMDPTRGSASR